MAGETFNYLLNAAKVMLFLIGSTMAAANENKKTIEEGLFFSTSQANVSNSKSIVT